MKRSSFAVAAVLGLACALSAKAQIAPYNGAFVPGSPFPGLAYDTLGPAVLLNYNNGVLTVTAGPGAAQGPYDGVEDTYVGVQNLSPANGNTLNSITLTGANIFGFDGDGQAYYNRVGNLATGAEISYGPTGYEGPGTSFNIVNVNNGTVFFTGGLAPGATAWFTLEENLSGANGNGGGGFTASVPDAGSTIALLGMGMVGLGAVRRRFKI